MGTSLRPGQLRILGQAAEGWGWGRQGASLSPSFPQRPLHLVKIRRPCATPASQLGIFTPERKNHK